MMMCCIDMYKTVPNARSTGVVLCLGSVVLYNGVSECLRLCYPAPGKNSLGVLKATFMTPSPFTVTEALANLPFKMDRLWGVRFT